MSVNLEITPSNVASNGIISFRDGNPLIQFIIGEQDRALLGRSVRLCGDFAVRMASGKGDDSYVVGSSNVQMNPRLGIYNIIDQLVIKSQVTHQTIEHIRHYNRFCSSFIPVLNSLTDCVGHLSETALIMPNFECLKLSVLRNPAQRLSGNSFCAHLPCGLFNGVQAIPLAGTKGLLIEVHLAPDANVLFTLDGQGGQTTLGNAYYELTNVKLVCEATAMDATTEGTFEYNSISTYYTSINSTNAIINFNLGLKRVLGVFANFLPAQNINNLNADGLSTSVLFGGSTETVNSSSNNGAPIKQAIFVRGGQRFPLEYNLDTAQKNPLGSVGWAKNEKADPQLSRNFLDSVRSFSQIGRSLISTNNTFLSSEAGGVTGSLSQTGNIGGFDKTNGEGGLVYGVGVAYDTISGDGVDFSTQNWGLQLETEIESDSPHAVYVFVHAKNTLFFNTGGIQVMS